VVSSLEPGGAERQVVELARHLDPGRFEVIVCSLGAEVPLAAALPTHVSLVVLGKSWRFDARPVARLARLLRRRAVALVHAFLFDAEMAARLAGSLAGVPVVVGSERNSDYRRPWHQVLLLRLTRPLVTGIVANSQAGRRFAARTQGLPEGRVWTLPNGVDLDRFHPRPGAEARRRLGLPADVPVVGMVASFKPQKDHPMLVAAARAVLRSRPETLFVCAGEPLRGAGGGGLSLRTGTGAHRDVAGYHARVSSLLAESGVGDSFRMLGAVREIEWLYPACDVTVLTSRHEGTPNVLLESMASGVPVVATRVADNAAVSPEGRVGYLVDPGDVEGLGARLLELLGDPEHRRRLGDAARAWVAERYSVRAVARQAEELYLTLLRGRGVLPSTPASEEAACSR
jgi:glycosyltransferase involved in cell wall biosynthesis